MDKVVLLERLPYPRATLGKPTLHSIYLILTASVYMAYFTFASGSRVPLGDFFSCKHFDSPARDNSVGTL